MEVSKKLVLQGIIGGALGLALVTLLISILGFNGEDYYHDDPLGMQFGMKVEAMSGEVYVWMHVPRALYVKSTILSVIKFDGDGESHSAGLTDMFPITETTHGALEIAFEIYTVDEDVMPDLANRSQSLMPMAYVSKESQLPTIARYMVLAMVAAINNWTLVKYMYLSSSFMAIILGIALRYKNGKSDNNLVMEMEFKERPR